MPDRRAEATWEGNLTEGHGNITSTGSGAMSNLPVTWRARTESSEGQTSPEELLAAAHAACFSMAFSNGLNKAGHPPERLTVSATTTFDKKPEGGFKVSRTRLDVRGRVPGLSAEEFTRLAAEAGQGCPISGALHGNVDITVDAQLEQ